MMQPHAARRERDDCREQHRGRLLHPRRTTSDRWGFERGISAYFWGTRVRDDRYLAKVLELRESASARSLSLLSLDPRSAPGAEPLQSLPSPACGSPRRSDRVPCGRTQPRSAIAYRLPWGAGCRPRGRSRVRGTHERDDERGDAPLWARAMGCDASRPASRAATAAPSSAVRGCPPSRARVARRSSTASVSTRAATPRWRAGFAAPGLRGARVRSHRPRSEASGRARPRRRPSS